MLEQTEKPRHLPREEQEAGTGLQAALGLVRN